MVEGGGSDEAVVALEIGEGFAGLRTHQAVDFAVIVALFLERSLDVGNDFIERAAHFAGVDRTVRHDTRDRTRHSGITELCLCASDPSFGCA